jgi:hypothetical protein
MQIHAKEFTYKIKSKFIAFWPKISPFFYWGLVMFHGIHRLIKMMDIVISDNFYSTHDRSIVSQKKKYYFMDQFWYIFQSLTRNFLVYYTGGAK